MAKALARGFTLIELLVVIAIIGILASIVLVSLTTGREKARVAKTQEEFHQLDNSLEMYANDNGGIYPADVNRGLPPGLESYLPSGNWPNAPWTGSVYDWDNWAPSNLVYPPNGANDQVYQISVRFCPISGTLSQCQFPNEPWAAGFGVDSAAYYCVSGPCRSHASQPISYPGYCLNCGQ